MPLHVHSSRLSYEGPDRLDITRKSGDRHGLPFAPSWAILNPALKELARARDYDKRAELHVELGLEKNATLVGYLVEAGRIEDAAWERYRPAFIAEMRRSYREERAAWNALLARDRVVLCCFCAAWQQCHRFILRTEILPKLGAVDAGEIRVNSWGEVI
jgi:hypothetical protein